MEGFYYLRDVVDADKLVAAIAELKQTDGKVRCSRLLGSGWRQNKGRVRFMASIRFSR